ncbi:hypothetical protein IC235_00755 [Hymenobacter sp. BT664]|uniref:Uncharacterized protein n=1 Tax=Hymenobacter montanus TaxID=2771359 RepID=A0A927B951_9BACT|nr:hypothetical protein [Hymenobacter montanus]MBD2766417.1 hypothetical protein [Hymenobacter montanus]
MHEHHSLGTGGLRERLSPLLPGQEWSPGTAVQNMQLFVEAVLWRARCGVS